jgi:hypothetical protein
MALRYMIPVVLSLTLAACESLPEIPTLGEAGQLVGLVPDQPCELTRAEGRRGVGAFLRKPEGAFGYDAIFVAGRINRRGLQRNIVFDDTAIRRLRPRDDDGLGGSRRSSAVRRGGFGRTGLPNVYDLTYRTQRVNYEGPLVIGPGPAATEIPSTGRLIFAGRAEMEIRLEGAEGGVISQAATGRFRFEAGYGTGRGRLTIDGLASDGALPFTALTWTELYLCGARFVSSGQGEVRVTTPEGRDRYPFQTGRDPVPLRAALEASQFAPAARPGPPDALGGVLLVESDQGTISAVFLSDAPPAPLPSPPAEEAS